MKKILLLACTIAAFTSCTVDKIDTAQAEQNLAYSTSTDNSSLGMYKGVFTTNDSKYRGTIHVDVPQKYTLANNTSGLLYPTAYITLDTGEVIIAKATEKVYEGEAIHGLKFASNDMSFRLSVNSDGTEPTISEVVYKQIEGAFLIAKHTELAPVTPIAGTYSCTDCGGSPYLDNGFTQTFNMVFTNPDTDGNIDIQVVRDSNIYNGIGFQDNCSASGVISNCAVNSGDGVATTVSHMANGKPVYWTGSHTFNNEATGPNDCSGFSGTWEWESRVYGVLTGTLTSTDNCFNTIFTEGFDTFAGAGFDPNPIVGQLDSDIFIATGFNGGTLAYGGMATSGGDFGRGSSTGGVTTGGIYAFETSTNDFAWGVQPGGSDFTPGTFEVKVENVSGADLSTIHIMYDLFVLNDEGRGNSLNFSYSTDGTNFTALPALDFTSPDAADANGWTVAPRSATFSASVLNNGFLYLRFTGEDVSGGGARDEFAIDNIFVEGI